MRAIGKLLAMLLVGCVLSGLVGMVAAAPMRVPSQPYTWKNVEIVGGGFVPGIVFNPSEPNLIYARTDIGGAYRWDQASRRWVQLMNWVSADDWNLSGVDSLATDPVDPNRVYVLAGTYTNDWTSQNGAVLRSADRGVTWQRANLPFKSGGNMPGRGMGERLAIDPNRNSTLYLGARSGNGLWRSTDYGATWSKVTSFPNPGTYIPVPGDAYQGDNVGVVWVTFDPRSGTPGSTTRTIYVGVADPASSIYRSTDGGATWAAVPGQPTGFLPHHGVLSSDGFLYISYSDGAGPYDGTKGDVWKLNTATGAWTNISPVPSSSADDYFGYGGLAVDAQNPQTLMVATLNSWWPDAIIYRSTNGGATWSPIWEWAGYPSRNLRYTLDTSAAPWLDFGTNPAPPEVTPKLGWMINDLEIDPFNSNRMLYGTGATIYGSENLTNWDSGTRIDIKVFAQGIEETAIQELLSPSAGAPLLSGMYDVNGFRHDDLTRVPTKMFSTPSFATTGLDFAEGSPNFIARVGSSDSVQRIGFSYDGGANWFAGAEPPGAVNAGKVAVAPSGTTVVWSGPGMPVSVTGNNGSSWSASSGIPTGAIVVSDRVNSSKFYGLLNGSFYASSNGAASFSVTATNLPTNTTKLRAVPGIEGNVWVAGGEGGLWRTTNSGAAFSKLANVEVAHVVGFGKAAPGQSHPAVFITGTIDGVDGFFRSDDAGASWVRINDDQHQYASTNTTITGDPRIYGRVYIGTNGYGIVYGDIAGSQPTVTPRTVTPTTRPSVTPTARPSVTPTARPSVTPTARPSVTPTVRPSVTPTVRPSVTPTARPSVTPTARPSVTPTARPSVTPTPGVGGGCQVTYTLNDWGSGFTAEVTVRNNGTSPISGWTLAWAFGGNQQIGNIWNATYTQSSANVAASNMPYNGTISAGGTVSFGFQASYSGSNARPASFTLNGAACTVTP